MQTKRKTFGKRTLSAALSAAMVLSAVPASVFTADAAVGIYFTTPPRNNCYTDKLPTVLWEYNATNMWADAYIYQVSDKNGSNPVQITKIGPASFKTASWYVDDYAQLGHYYQVWLKDTKSSDVVKSSTFYLDTAPKITSQMKDYYLGSGDEPTYGINFPAAKTELYGGFTHLKTYDDYGDDWNVLSNISRRGPIYKDEDFGEPDNHVTYTFRSYYTPTKYVETEPFHVFQAEIEEQPEDAVIYNMSPNGTTATANFPIKGVRLVTNQSTKELDTSRYVLSEDGRSVKVKFSQADANISNKYWLELKYGSKDTAWVKTDEFRCYSDTFEYTLQPQDVLVKESEVGSVEHAVECSDYNISPEYEEVLADGEVIDYCEGDYFYIYNVDTSLAGKELKFRTYYPSWNDEFEKNYSDYIESDVFHVRGMANVNFVVQPIDVDLPEDGSEGLATCAVDFEPRGAALYKGEEKISDKCTWTFEGGSAVINCPVTADMKGDDIKFRVYYGDDGEYIDSDTFAVTQYKITSQPGREIYLYRNTNTRELVYETNFPVDTAKVMDYWNNTTYSDAVIKIENTEDKGKVTFTANSDFEYKTVYLSIRPKGSGNALKTAATDIYPAFEPDFYELPQSIVFPDDVNEVSVIFGCEFDFTDYELYTDGKLVSSYHCDPVSFNYVELTRDIAGKDLVLKVTVPASEARGTPEEYLESPVFKAVLPDSSHKFSMQPNDMDITSGDLHHLTWNTNFTPVKVEVTTNLTYSYYTLPDPTQKSLDYIFWYSNSFDSDIYRLKAYYGEGDLDYVYSDTFKSVRPAFSVEPMGGYAPTGENLKIEWDTNFKPVKQELWADNAFVKELKADAKSVELDGIGVNNYQIVSYYDDDENSAVFSAYFFVKLTNAPVYKLKANKDVIFYNSDGYYTSSAIEGETVEVLFVGSYEDFGSWGSKSGNVNFDDPENDYTHFTMPAGDVEIIINKPKAQGLKGDVNGDGKINVTDVSKAAAHVKNIKSLDSDAVSRADVNDDGKINITDVSKIAAHVKGVKTLH